MKKYALILTLLFSLDASAQFDDLLLLGITQEDPEYHYNRSLGENTREWTIWKYNSTGDSILSGEIWTTKFNSKGLPMMSTDLRGNPRFKRKYEGENIVGIKKINRRNEYIGRYSMEYDSLDRPILMKRFNIDDDGSEDQSLRKDYTYSDRVNNQDSIIVESTYGNKIIVRNFDDENRLVSYEIGPRNEIEDSGVLTYEDGILTSQVLTSHYRSGNLIFTYTYSDGMLVKKTSAKHDKIYESVSYFYTELGNIERIETEKNGQLWKRMLFTYTK